MEEALRPRLARLQQQSSAQHENKDQTLATEITGNLKFWTEQKDISWGEI